MEDVRETTTSIAAENPHFDTGIDPLVDQVAQAVEAATGGRVHKLVVEIAGDTIRLQGFCATFHCNQLAQTAAMDVAGEAVVENQIVVW